MTPAYVLQALRELALGEIGSTEVLATGALLLGAYEGSNDEARLSLAFQNPRAEIAIKGWELTTITPRFSDTSVHKIDVEITIHVTTGFELNDDGREAARATMITLGERLCAALTRPGNLVLTSDAHATGIVSGCAMKASVKVDTEDFKKRLIVAKIDAELLVASTRPT